MLLSLILAILWTTAACSSGSNNKGNNTNSDTPAATNEGSSSTEPVDPIGKYEETVEYTTVRGINQDPKFPAGESYENNMFTKFQEEKLNVKEKIEWMAPTDGEQYANKLAISIASGDIPDVFTVEGSKRDALLKQLVEGDMIEDLTEVFEKYASPRLKEIYGALDNVSLKQVTYDGKIMAIPAQMDMSQTNVVWVRQDWLEELKLPEPTSIENLRTVAKAFADKKGMGLSLRAAPDGVSSKSGDMQKFDAVFNYLGAYPSIWVKKEDGSIDWGGIQPQVKEGLKIAAEMYKNGELDKEFAIKDNGKTAEDIGANKTGLFFQPWWAPLWPMQNSVTNDPNAKWKAYGLAKDGVIHASIDTPATSYYVVRKGFKNPELIVKLINLNVDVKNGKYEELIDARNTGLYKDATEKHPQFPGLGAGMTDHNTVVKTMTLFQQVLDGQADESTLNKEQKTIFDKIKSYEPLKDQAVAKDDVSNWQQYTAWAVGLKPTIDNKEEIVFNAFPGTTPTMEKKWALLQDQQKEAYIKIIMGDESLDYFDSFAAKWKSSGGDEITKEVNEAAKK